MKVTSEVFPFIPAIFYDKALYLLLRINKELSHCVLIFPIEKLLHFQTVKKCNLSFIQLRKKNLLPS